MKIGELALAAQCTVETVRYYEKEGLLPAPARTQTNQRRYGRAHAERLRFIRNCRTLDMTHGEIRALLSMMDQPAGDCAGVTRLLEEHIAHVDVRIAELSRLKQQLRELRNCCRNRQPVDTCGILRELVSMETQASHERHTHLG